MFDLKAESDNLEMGSVSTCSDCDCQHETTKMERFGACRSSGCSCSSFSYSNDAQWCDNCGHSRSQHIH